MACRVEQDRSNVAPAIQHFDIRNCQAKSPKAHFTIGHYLAPRDTIVAGFEWAGRLLVMPTGVIRQAEIDNRILDFKGAEITVQPPSAFGVNCNEFFAE